jgi:hypothetical protein
LWSAPAGLTDHSAGTTGTTVLSSPPPAVTEATGTLVLPLTGEVQAEGLSFSGSGESDGAVSGSSSSFAALKNAHASASMSAPVSSEAAGATADQSVDVPPGTSQTMKRLFTHISSDRVIVSTFMTPMAQAPGVFQNPAVSQSPPAVVGPGSEKAGSVADPQNVNRTTISCAPTGQLTLEISDTKAVAIFTEPFYEGFVEPLIDVEIGDIGVTEGSPATWVEAQVGSSADQVLVQFADGSTDSMAPSEGVAVLARDGDAAETLGGPNGAKLEVLGSGGVVLADYRIFVGNSAETTQGAFPPVVLPGPFKGPGPSDPKVAREDVESALKTALSCSEPPIVQSQAVTDGGAYEEIGGASNTGIAAGDRVVVDKVEFTSRSNAEIQFHIAGQGLSQPQILAASASLSSSRWRISIGSVAPGLQIAPPNQDGDVSVAPGGPLFVSTGPGGVAVAVYRAQRSSDSGNGCAGEECVGNPSQTCASTGGLVEEITTPGAVAIESSALFANYTGPLIGVGLGIVGEAEGSPATLVSAEVGPSVAKVEIASRSGVESFAPDDGVVEAALAGAPASAIGKTGGSLTAVDSAGQTVASEPFSVDASEPAPASSLPSNLPPPGSGSPPPNPAKATSQIDQVFGTVFDCANSPFVRSSVIEDNGMFANPLEQLYLGPYTSLVESVYATVGGVVFVNPTLADVSYTIRFHDDPTLSFDEIGTAVVVDGAWRVSYATLCAAVSLGGVSCSS